MACLTLVYVVTNVIMAIIMLRANNLSRQNLTQAMELERMRSRPYLVFDVEMRHNAIHAVLRNMGQTAAFNVEINISPQIKGMISGLERVPTLHIIFTLLGII